MNTRQLLESLELGEKSKEILQEIGPELTNHPELFNDFIFRKLVMLLEDIEREKSKVVMD